MEIFVYLKNQSLTPHQEHGTHLVIAGQYELEFFTQRQQAIYKEIRHEDDRSRK
jgi:hypothetical protein